MKLTFSRILSLALVLICLAPCVRAVDRSKKLTPQYRHWINEEVNYIISSEEKKQFLNLQTDAERDHFIEHFWQALNPTPQAQSNPYKQEHYRRLAYANEHYGSLEAQDGWRTDQGHMYIVLGAPKQVETYPAARNVRPIEIWFYQGQNRALPPYFNLLFYKRSITEPFTLYSPYQDGPARLTSTLEDLNDQKRAIKTLRNSLGDAVAKTALSLIPGEAVSFDDYTPSLTSDMMLGTIEGLADNPLTRSLKAERRSNEQTISTLYYGGDTTQLETAIFRDTADRMTASYLIRYRDPQAELIGPLPNGHQGYSVTAQITVLTPAGKPVYRDVEQFGGEVAGDVQIENARTKLFGAEGRLPLAPGKYQLLISLTNNLTKAGTRKQAQFTVPDPKSVSWGMSKLLAFSPQPPSKHPDRELPFTIAGVRFVPRGSDNISLHHGEPLRIAFQLWSGASDAATRAERKISVHYAYGSFGEGAHPLDETEEVNGADFDADGNLLTGRTFPTVDLAPGNYRMVVTAIDEKTQEKAYSTMNFRIVDDADTEAIDLWTAFNTVPVNPRATATDDYKRGISAIASGNSAAGTYWLQQSLKDDPTFSQAITKLVTFYSMGGQETGDKEIAALSHQYALTQELDEFTAIRMALANAKSGDLAEAKHILDFELGFQAPDPKFYQAIADVYQQMGNTAGATEFRKRAAAL